MNVKLKSSKNLPSDADAVPSAVDASRALCAVGRRGPSGSSYHEIGVEVSTHPLKDAWWRYYSFLEREVGRVQEVPPDCQNHQDGYLGQVQADSHKD